MASFRDSLRVRMKRTRRPCLCPRVLVTLLLLWPAWFPASTRADDAGTIPPEPLVVEEILRRVYERCDSLTNQLEDARYTFQRRTLSEELDAQGRVKERTLREHTVSVDGAQQDVLLVTLNGVPPSESERRREQRRDEGHREKFAPRQERSSRITKRLDRELLERFRYRLLGTESVMGRWTYRLEFEPVPGRVGSRVADRILSRLEGSLWVDATDFEIARIEGTLLDPVSIGGFLAVLDELRMVVVRRPLFPGHWVDERVDTHIGGRKLVKRFHGRLEMTQTDFQFSPSSVPLRPHASP